MGSFKGRFAVAAIAATMGQVASAQRRVGLVTDVRQVTASRSGCRTSSEVSASKALTRARPPSPPERLDAPFPKDLALGDRFALDGGSDARLRIDDQVFGRGVIVLAPQLLCDAWIADSTFGRASRSSGAYVLDTVVVASRGLSLRLTIEQGAAFVQWDSTLQYRLRVNSIDLTGTEIVVVVDSLSRRSLLYVRRGTVTLSATPGFAVVSGSVYLLAPGRIPQLLSLTGSTSSEIDDDIEYHSGVIWRGRSGLLKRLFSKPATYAVIPAVGYVAYRLLHKPAKTHTATVTVQVPL